MSNTTTSYPYSVAWKKTRVSQLSYLLLVTVFIASTVALILGIVALVRTTEQNSKTLDKDHHRFCLYASEEHKKLWGTLLLKKSSDASSSCTVEWDLITVAYDTPFTGLHIHGPIVAAAPHVADIFVFLNTADTHHYNYEAASSIKGSLDIHCSKIDAIEKFPIAYYLCLKDAENPQNGPKAFLKNKC